MKKTGNRQKMSITRADDVMELVYEYVSSCAVYLLVAVFLCVSFIIRFDEIYPSG